MNKTKKQLEDAGYIVAIRSPHHLQVFKPGVHNVTVNVWPGPKKILKQYSPGPAPRYKDIVRTMAMQFGTVVFKDRAPESDELAHLLWWRQDPLPRLADYLKHIQ